MTGAMTPHRSTAAARQENFWRLVHAEWTKFRTVRGWVIAMIVVIGAITAFVFVAGSVSRSCASSTGGGSPAATASACPPQPVGPGGEPVQDDFYFVHQALTGNGTITVQMTSLTGQVDVNQAPGGAPEMRPGSQPWSKAGIIIKQDTSQGSAYAAMMVTGSNGVRMQWDYVNDTPGQRGRVSASSPRWLRLVRAGSTISGYDSADGTHWTLVGRATLPGLTGTVQAGLFAASPGNPNTGATFTATGVFRHIGLSWPSAGWTGINIGGPDGVPLPGTFRRGASMLSVTGSGDIAPLAGNGVISIQTVLTGTFIGLIPLLVVGAMFITAEYRRGLIRVSVAASPRRGRLLAAKAVVVGAVSFVTGLVAASLAVVVGSHVLARTNVPVWPASAPTDAGLIAGTAALLAVAAVLALAIGTIARRSAPAITAAIVLTFVPILLATRPQQGPLGGASGSGDWLLRITPAAGFSVQQAVPRFPQVTGAIYTPAGGYYPLAPWAGFAVECGWAVAALALALYLLRRRDA